MRLETVCAADGDRDDDDPAIVTLYYIFTKKSLMLRSSCPSAVGLISSDMLSRFLARQMETS